MSGTNPSKLILEDDWKAGRGEPAPAKPAPIDPTQARPAGTDSAGPSKLVVDSDWKSEAQAEKVKLAEGEKKAAASRPAASAGAGAGARELPVADFKTLVGTLVSQAGMYMGWFPDAQGRAMVSLEYARFHIDLLGVLAEKTKGNVTPEESEELVAALVELRSNFVELSRAVAQGALERAQGGPKAGAAPPNLMGG